MEPIRTSHSEKSRSISPHKMSRDRDKTVAQRHIKALACRGHCTSARAGAPGTPPDAAPSASPGCHQSPLGPGWACGSQHQRHLRRGQRPHREEAAHARRERERESGNQLLARLMPQQTTYHTAGASASTNRTRCSPTFSQPVACVIAGAMQCATAVDSVVVVKPDCRLLY